MASFESESREYPGRNCKRYQGHVVIDGDDPYAKGV